MARDYELARRLEALGVTAKARTALEAYRPAVDQASKASSKEIQVLLQRMDPELAAKTGETGAGRQFVKHMDMWATTTTPTCPCA